MILLASDTETKPSTDMRQAMVSAEVGDEQKGQDPTVNNLLDRVCDLLGKEASIFLPTGTMCNLVSIKAHTHPGEVVLADQMSHILRAESGGSPLASGIQVEAIPCERGIFTAKDLEEAYCRVQAVPYPYGPRPRVVCLEQTHNLGGGTIWQLEELSEVWSKAKDLGLLVHMDGARLLNAVVASGTSAKEMSAFSDSVWIDFSKGLGAPMGAVLAGSRDFIERARLFKHMFGGAMRQAGIVAAACLYALDHNMERLAQDHDNAKLLAQGLSNIQGVRLLTPEPESNMVFFEVPGFQKGTQAFLDELKKRGVAMSALRRGIRAVTHLDVSKDDILKAVEIIREILATG